MQNNVSRFLQLLLEKVERLSRRKLFGRAGAPLNAFQTIAWWEKRRIPYNFIVGCAGMVTIFLCVASELAAELVLDSIMFLPDPPLFAVVWIFLYGIMANICYTGGWIAELLAVNVWKEQSRQLGPIAFMLGVIFSVLLTLLPGALILIILISKLFLHFLCMG